MNEDDRVVGFLSPEVLMDAWVTGQQYARRTPPSAIRGWARKLRRVEPYTYRWWRLQGALADVSSREVFAPEPPRQRENTKRASTGFDNER